MTNVRNFADNLINQKRIESSDTRSLHQTEQTSGDVEIRNKLTLSMVIKNESERYLSRVLSEHKQYIDEAVIIDDGSKDRSAEMCQDILHGIPLHLVRNDVSRFSNESVLRKQQWHETIRTEPEWILNLDADEMFESRFKDEVRALIRNDHIDVYCFRLYDFWNEDHYREDRYWCAHLTYRPFLVRYRSNFTYTWRETPQHCGRFPANLFMQPSAISSLRLKHFGWANERDRVKKYQRYLELDPGGTYGWAEQYESILDKNPRLIKWEE